MKLKKLTLFIGVAIMGFFSTGESADLKPGTKAPMFSLKAQDDKTYSLADYKGQWVVLYFYPKDDTPGCTKQACSIRDGQESLKKAGIVVFGASSDDVESHKKFAEKYKLNFPILADEKKELVKAYGVDGMLGMAKRHTFIIGPDQTIKSVMTDVDVKAHADEIIKEVQKQR